MLEEAIWAKLQLKVFWQLGHALRSGAGGLGSLGAGGGGDEAVTQHWMSLLPGQYPSSNLPPLHPLLLTLRQ
jgi:hypothetical protein